MPAYLPTKLNKAHLFVSEQTFVSLQYERTNERVCARRFESSGSNGIIINSTS